jgi:hypothetical protein
MVDGVAQDIPELKPFESATDAAALVGRQHCEFGGANAKNGVPFTDSKHALYVKLEALGYKPQKLQGNNLLKRWGSNVGFRLKIRFLPKDTGTGAAASAAASARAHRSA